MLVLTQLLLGGFLIELIIRLGGFGGGSTLHLWLSLGLGYVGLAASLLHLGRPHLAYRAILGLRHWWLSREILAFGLFAKLATAFVAAELASSWLSAHSLLQAVSCVDSGRLRPVRGGLLGDGLSRCPPTLLAGFIERRQVRGDDHWRGLATALASLAVLRPAATLVTLIAGALIVVTVAKLWFVARPPRARRGRAFATYGLATPRSFETTGRTLQVLLGIAGGVILPWRVAIVGAVSGDSGAVTSLAVLSLAATTGGELIERYLFFRAVTQPKMPGGAALMKRSLPESMFRRFRSLVRSEGRKADPRAIASAGRFGWGRSPPKTPDATRGWSAAFARRVAG